ncbi:MAG: serine hydrolase domain-containing protein, partial [Ramlibacter sp.]
MLVSAALSAAGAAPASPLPEPQAAALTRQLQAIVNDPAMPLAGLSVVAIRHGEVVYRRHFGSKRLATAGAPARPIDDATLFRVASVSKFVTALGAMKLVEQGKLSLDADIGSYLGYRLRNPHFPDRPLTLRMLLTHTSSLRDDGGFKWDPEVDLKDVLLPGGRHHGKGAMWSAAHAPGSWFEYVNFDWGVLATVMEAATGERFDRLMRRLLFDPMGLKAGFYLADFAPADVKDVATLYRKREKDGMETWDPNGPWIAQADDFGVQPPVAPPGLEAYQPGSNGTVFGPQGSLRISTADLTQIMLLLMHGGRHGDRQILAPQTLAAMFERQWTLRPEGTDQRANGSTNGDGGSHRGLYHAWGLGNQHFTDTSIITDQPGQPSHQPGDGRARGDRLVERGGFTGVGHLGWSWGLNALFVFDPASQDGMIYVSSGVGADPERQP